MATTDADRPFILYCVPSAPGHMIPAIQICGHLVSRGFDVTITGIEPFRPLIESIGAHLAPTLGLMGNMAAFFEMFPEIGRNAATNTSPNIDKVLETVFVDMIPSGLETLRFGLAELQRRDPTRRIIILSDTAFSGTLAFKLAGEMALPPGFQGPLPKTLGISVVPAMFTSVDTGPWGTALGYDPSEQGRARNKLVARWAYRSALSAEPMRERQRQALRMCGIPKSVDSLFGEHAGVIDHGIGDAGFVCHDTTLQMCIPSLEYPVSDWPASIKFGGTLPVKPLAAGMEHPAWFDEVKAAGRQGRDAVDRRRVVMVAQGTVGVDPELLVLPTVKGLAERDDLLVVVILCVRGATLDTRLEEFPDQQLPPNVRVVDYFPYDAVLEHADVFVTNSGYG